MIDPYARLTKSSPASTFAQLLFLLIIQIYLILRLNDIMLEKKFFANQYIREIIIAAIGILQLIDFICWFINPVDNLFAALLALFTFLLSGFHNLLWYLQNNQFQSHNEELHDEMTQKTLKKQSLENIPQKSKCFGCCVYTTFAFILLLAVLNTCQIAHEANHPTSLGQGENFYVVQSQGQDVRIRTYCLGEQNSTQIILEAGGGSSGVDFYLIQTQLSENYRVCSYDRAGYGMSWQAAAPQSQENTMIIAEQVMNKVGFNTSIPNSIICVGHSVGGQLCRFYATQMSSIQGIFLLDSVPVMNWFFLVGQCQNQSTNQIYQQQVSKTPLIKTMASFWPFFLETPFFISSEGFEPPNLQGWINWQITTTRNWYSQSLGFDAELEECNEQCMQQSIITSSAIVDKPIIVITASNQSITCADRNLTGGSCDYYLCSMNASLELSVDQSLLGNQISTYVECPGICSHDFVWKQPDFIVQQIEYYIPLF